MRNKYAIKKILKGYSSISSEIKFPILICICSVLMIYMQYSKHTWAMGGVCSSFEYIKYFYAEFSSIALVVMIAFFSKKRTFFLVIFLSYYYLAIFNFSSWFIQARPFSLFDIYRTIQLVLFYPEFVTKIPHILQIKIAFFASIPFVFIVMMLLCRHYKWYQQLYFSYAANKICIMSFVFVALSTPLGIYANAFQYNTFSEIVNEYFYNIKVNKISRHPEEVFRMLGTVNNNLKKEHPWSFDKKNIILFIIETAPYDIFPSIKELCQLTSNFWIAEHGRVFTQHYTTYPESDRAIFSLISGRYPYLTNGDSWKQNIRTDSLAIFLNNNGFSTYFLGTAPMEFRQDSYMIRGLGFNHIFDVKEITSALKVVNGARVWDRSQIYKFDNILIEKALSIISTHAQKDTKPFFLTIAPQSSHAPFNLPPGSPNATSDQEKIKLNAIWQFDLIKALITTLQNTGQIDNTVIIITGDHGIRHEYESKLFINPRILNSLTFHVPLMIAFSEIKSSVVDDYITSHVDITKTIISAFQPEENGGEYHGIDLFSSILPNRDVFFFGGNYLPVTGLVNNKGYFMANRYQGWYFRNTKFDFSLGARKELFGKDQKDLSKKIL
ncbi:LTA synthase family protein, partial [Desulfobacula sp.]|nr:sulfatase-like hydrolase/transferase [Desulfobacula sp.]